MTRSELVKRLLPNNVDLTHQQVETVVNVILEEISQALAKGNRVELRGFGSFHVRRRSARMGRNPKTGEAISVSAKGAPLFKASKILLKRLNAS